MEVRNRPICFVIREPVKKVAVVMLGAIFSALCPGAYAAFVDGVERFSGTAKDPATWEEYDAPYGGTIYQYDALFLDMVQSNVVDYTTRTVTVGVGDIVRVELLEHPSGRARSTVYLTTNSAGTGGYTGQDSHFLFLQYSYWAPTDELRFVAGSGSSGSGTGTIFGKDTPPPSPFDPYFLQIERTSSSSAIFSAFTSNMTLIGSVTRDWFFHPGVPDDLFISLAGWAENGGITCYDNVTIIPEPSTLLLIGLGTLLIAKKR
jgi:hypothetical protein